jgi:hypothetical protein
MAKLGTIGRELQIKLADTLSIENRQKIAANIAKDVLNETLASNRAILGHDTEYEQFVDGRADAALNSVNPDGGTIVFTFDVVNSALEWIGKQLLLNSPVGKGPIHYKDSHILLADGVEIDADGEIPPADEYVFVNKLPYARKIERGESEQAPDGVYEVVADMASRRFGNVAKIRFTYRALYQPATRSKADKSASRDSRNPAISVITK